MIYDKKDILINILAVHAGIDGGFETGLPVDFLETTTSV